MTARQIRRAAEREVRKEARRETNRANAQFSTGPSSEEGKAVSSRNALKTALTGRTVLLPGDDRDRYRLHLHAYFELWRPAGEHECVLVQAIADTWWRLARIPLLEQALYAKGRAELADHDPALVELESYLLYEKQFRNLALQERRLSSYAARLKSELEEMQARRVAESDAQSHIESTSPEPAGFEFSGPVPPASSSAPLHSENASTVDHASQAG